MSPTIDDNSLPFTRDDAVPSPPARGIYSHKGTFGLALLIGGSRGMSGAISLSGMSALRGGAGLVRLAVPDVCLDAVAATEPSYMTLPLKSSRHGLIAWSDAQYAMLFDEAEKTQAVAIGPGLGRSDALTILVSRLYSSVSTPMVVDADALNALAAIGGISALQRPGGPRILTPHPGEFERLTGEKPDVSVSARQHAAVRLAAQIPDGVVVLKGPGTCVATADTCFVNTTGNPGLATGGSGDVLTGLITALLAQGMTPFDAARLAVNRHGRAGDLAAESLGQVSMIASDLIGFLPQAFREM
jgi:ADP-dependent NAD(P)H-hydrate dehydratase